ncbi:hypothetical protein [Ileibacterium valens]|uniref:hypothetical protein n=1 Tax=Ileibacterium valens TaxID=1862668 RepID=UPI0024B8EB29|nr:hypothetical protein [Ileibacterium valens]
MSNTSVNPDVYAGNTTRPTGHELSVHCSQMTECIQKQVLPRGKAKRPLAGSGSECDDGSRVMSW